MTYLVAGGPSFIASNFVLDWLAALETAGEHDFNLLCVSLGAEHRLTKPRTPNTNGIVERFSGRLEYVLLTHRFNSA